MRQCFAERQTRFACAILVTIIGTGGNAIGDAGAPQGPAAKQFAAWAAAFNRSDRAALAAYHELSFPYSAASPGIDTLEREYALSIETGGLEVKRVESVSPTSYSAIVMDPATHQCARAMMRVDAAPPHRVVSFELQAVAKPEELREAERPLDASRRRSLVDAMVRVIEARYIFPDVGYRMITALREHAARGDYDRLTDCAAFADRVSEDLQTVSHDRHLRVTYRQPNGPPPPKPDPRGLGFGFGAIDRLPGNIAHVVIHRFMRADKVRAAIGDFMTRIADADAVVIDLRDNHGGDPATVALVASYLFDDTPVHLNDMVERDGTTTSSWTDPNVPGKRFGGRRPVYVITSAATVSGGEELAYDLKALRRATLIGEKTVGAANPGDGHTLDDWFVITDVAVSANAALEEALRRARSSIRTSRRTADDFGAQVQEEGGADQTEADARSDERDERGDRKHRQDHERAAPCQAPRPLGGPRGVRASQYLPLEDVVGDVDADEESCVKRDGR